MKRNLRLAWGLALAFALAGSVLVWATQSQNGSSAASKPVVLVYKVGTVKSINGNTIVLKVDSGPDFTAVVADSVRILRLPPGQHDLKNATPIKIGDIQAGYRILVRGEAGDTPDSIAARLIVVMKLTDLAQQQQQELQDWQRRGVGGIVTAMDAASGVITVASTSTAGYTVQTSKATGFLRYPPSSIKFADAQKSSFDQIKVGDQLRARGSRSPDGKQVTAEEVISGTFRNIAGVITAIDLTHNTLQVKDILGKAKRTVQVKVAPESQMRKLPAQLARRIAFFLKAPAGAQAAMRRGAPGFAGGGPPGANPGANGGPGQRPSRGGGPDFQQMISRLPAVTLADLQKDEAVMIVSTTGINGSEVTAITLLSGVEPILTASPSGSGAAALLSGWNLSAPSGDEGPQ